jgi:hypothetical protein
MLMKTYNLLLINLACICVYVMGINALPQNKLLQVTLHQQLIGEWRNQSIRIRLNIYDKAANPVVVEADSSSWEARLQIKPIRTHFKNDETYTSEYRNLKDSVIKTASGKWDIKGDSLTMNQLQPEKSTLKLHLSIIKNKATFSGIIDFDGNGKLDDEYFGVQKKFTP